ncbi:MAG: hypothetical protein M1837_007507 [Sclerophora amabilis]|nr:MAG: hypothetical protein M1837_007507 [Sclerophora amabilis]
MEQNPDSGFICDKGEDDLIYLEAYVFRAADWSNELLEGSTLDVAKDIALDFARERCQVLYDKNAAIIMNDDHDNVDKDKVVTTNIPFNITLYENAACDAFVAIYEFQELKGPIMEGTSTLKIDKVAAKEYGIILAPKHAVVHELAIGSGPTISHALRTRIYPERKPDQESQRVDDASGYVCVLLQIV